MDTVTYPDERVASFVDKHFVPVKVNVKEKPDAAAAFDVSWTPNVIITDDAGKARYRIEGYLPPEDFIGQLALGLGRYHLDRQEWPQAIHHFEEAVRRHQGSEIGA